MHFFHTIFHSLWKSTNRQTNKSGKPDENTMEKYVDFHSFMHGEGNQLPLISLIISSISARKTGF